MPIAHNPQLLGNSENLVSPARHLFHLSRNPWGPIQAPPDPSELPMPDKLMSKGKYKQLMTMEIPRFCTSQGNIKFGTFFQEMVYVMIPRIQE